MIDAKELRIGNIVEVILSPSKAEFWGIDSISLDLLTVYDLNSPDRKMDVDNRKRLEDEYLGRISPIPLTEEMLLKCGFNYDKEEDCWKICGLFIRKEDCGFRIYIECEDAWYSGCYFNDFRYLHQLQNIYFDLTGKELEVKL